MKDTYDIERIEVGMDKAGSLYEDTKRVVREGDFAWKVSLEYADILFQNERFAQRWVEDNLE